MNWCKTITCSSRLRTCNQLIASTYNH